MAKVKDVSLNGKSWLLFMEHNRDSQTNCGKIRGNVTVCRHIVCVAYINKLKTVNVTCKCKLRRHQIRVFQKNCLFLRP